MQIFTYSASPVSELRSASQITLHLHNQRNFSNQNKNLQEKLETNQTQPKSFVRSPKTLSNQTFIRLELARLNTSLLNIHLGSEHFTHASRSRYISLHLLAPYRSRKIHLYYSYNYLSLSSDSSGSIKSLLLQNTHLKSLEVVQGSSSSLVGQFLGRSRSSPLSVNVSSSPFLVNSSSSDALWQVWQDNVRQSNLLQGDGLSWDGWAVNQDLSVSNSWKVR